MKNAPTGHIIKEFNGLLYMTEATARAVAKKFKEMGSFSRVDMDEFGFGSGCHRVLLWSINSKSGNRNLHTVRVEPSTDEHYKLIEKIAKGDAKKRDMAAFERIEAERNANSQ